MIIDSLLNNDFYKVTMLNALLVCQLDAPVKYRLFDRKNLLHLSPQKYETLLREIDKLCSLSFREDELNWLANLKIGNQKILSRQCITFLRSFRFNKDNLRMTYNKDDFTLRVDIEGKWSETILWEVPLMAIISEVYHGGKGKFAAREYGWHVTDEFSVLKTLGLDVKVYDFGTRRRFSNRHHKEAFVELVDSQLIDGTSNMQFAYQWGQNPIGTVAHEWYMASYARVKKWDMVGDWEKIDDLELLANIWAVRDWQKAYKGVLGIALPDTFTTDKFLQSFDGIDSRTFDGLRQDSGDPRLFAQKVIRHYQDLGIDPSTKTLLFSDSLTPGKCLEIWSYIKNNYKVHPRLAFAIGTNLSNNNGVEPLGIVIKMIEYDGVPVYKKSDDPSKAIAVADEHKLHVDIARLKKQYEEELQYLEVEAE